MKKLTAILIAVVLLVSIAGCAKSEETVGNPTPSNPQLLTKAKAQDIALEQAGFTADQVAQIHTEYEVKDSTPLYKVEFHQGEYEYAYIIHAETGEVLSWDKERDPIDAPITTPADPNAPTPLTQPQAQAIALEHAQVTDVSSMVTKYEIDDGVPQYEIEFRKDDYEYDYTIHAETGEILEQSKEYDPPKTPPVEPKPETPAPTDPIPAERLSKESAQTIALEHAGFTADQVKGLRTEFDQDDGIPEYSVEFYADGWEYDYEIHAETGKILEWDKDND